MAAPPTPPAANVPPGWALAIALLVVGAALELVGRVSPGAAYTFVFLILLGYASIGDRLDVITGVLRQLGVIVGA